MSLLVIEEKHLANEQKYTKKTLYYSFDHGNTIKYFNTIINNTLDNNKNITIIYQSVYNK